MKRQIDNPKVSIIVTSYNVENYLEACLDSIVSQSLSDIEIIVVDDGSTDNCPKIIDKYQKRDQRIKSILFEKNSIGGVASAANAGIELACGKYIGFADGDDIYYQKMFEKLYHAAEKHEAEISICNYYLLDNNSGYRSNPADMNRWSKFANFKCVELNNNNKDRILEFISVPWRKLYRSDLLKVNEIQFPVGDYYFEDNVFHWLTTICARQIALVPEQLCEHRMHRSGQSMASSDVSLLKMFEHHATIKKWLVERGVYERFELSLIKWLNAQSAWIFEKIDKNLYEQYFETTSACFHTHSYRKIIYALRKQKIVYRQRLRSYFLQRQDKVGFFASFSPEDNFSILYQAYLHFRLYGFFDLIRVIFERSWGSLKSHKTSSKANLPNIDDKLDSIIIGLQILEQKIDHLEYKSKIKSDDK